MSFVTMVNPNTGDEAVAHPDAFENVWKPLGWTLADAPQSAPAATDDLSADESTTDKEQ